MKKLLTFSLTLITLLSLCAAARADVLWEPENRFYEKHRSECTHIGRSYYANGPDGFVTLYDAPNSSSYSAQYENGIVLNGQFQYQNWMCVSRWDQKEFVGWVPLSELYLVYDYISFEEEHGNEFQPYNGEFADYGGPVEGIELYKYPGYGWHFSTLTADQEDWLDNLRGTADTPSCISYIYRIPYKYADGSEEEIWGFVSYLYGYRNFWICLNNPTGDGRMNCSTEDVVVEDLIATGEITAPQPPVPPSGTYTPYFLVVGVVAVTAILLYVFYARGRKSTK